MRVVLSNGEADRNDKENHRLHQAQEAAQALPHLRQVHGGMTVTDDDVRRVLRTSYKPTVLAALSYVNLSDRELDTLILRYMRSLTIEKTAEWLDCSENSVKNWQTSGLEKCCKAWENLIFVQEILAAQ